tara:strand:+ start:5595 stop:7328 length:1734 start_codon:yes stop_codon:yes gene_type:complete
MLDSLGSQRYVEQQMLYERKVSSFEDQLEQLDEKRRALESSLGISQIEASQGGVLASDDEALRMSDYANATHATQARIAQENGSLAIQRSLIENERDRRLMNAELEANRKLATLENGSAPELQTPQSRLAAEKLRSETARLKALIESDTNRELRLIDEQFKSEIETKQEELSQQSGLRERQRMLAVLANADAGRRVDEEIEGVEKNIAELQGEKSKALSPFLRQIAELNEQIRSLEVQAAATESEFDSRLSAVQSRLSRLHTESVGLKAVTDGLIGSTSSPPSSYDSAADSRAVRMLEDAHKARREILLETRAKKLAEADQQLDNQLRALASASDGQQITESKVLLDLASAKTEITNRARSELAELEMRAEIAKANVVAPVVTTRAVYSGSYGDKPEVFAARTDRRNELRDRPSIAVAESRSEPAEKPAQSRTVSPSTERPQIAQVVRPEAQPTVEPIKVVSSFEPRQQPSQRSVVQSSVVSVGTVAGGQVQPLVIAPQGTTYTVVYRYSEKGSADKFTAYLKAYGVNDFTYRYSEKLDEHILYMGRYTDKEAAASRVAFLNRTTNTANALILENDL